MACLAHTNFCTMCSENTRQIYHRHALVRNNFDLFTIEIVTFAGVICNRPLMLESMSLVHPNEHASYGKNYFNPWDITSYCTAYLFEYIYTSFPDFTCTHTYMEALF